jgi:ABC-type glycerol-3-phosphate transport system permease component
MQANSGFEHVRVVEPRWTIWRQRFTRLLLYLALIIMAIAAMAPFYFMLSGSLMDRGEMFAIPPNLWPDVLIWENYRVIFRDYNFLTYLKNSMIISVAQTAGVLFFCSLAGYIFAKRKFPGRDALFIVILITATMPQGQATIIPFYLLMIKFDWVNTFWPLIVPWWAPPLSIFLMRQYISSGIHDDLIDASRLDGAGLFQTYWRVVVPLSAPGLVVIGVLQFIAIWNEFLYGLLILRTDDMRTVTVAIAELSTRTRAATLYGPLFAGIVISTIPTILLYFLFQRKLTSGILAGSVRA